MTNEGEFPKVDGDILFASEVNTFSPIGTVAPWLKTLTNTPVLPSTWVECNGQTISDATSVYDGVTIPDLNGDNRFLRGNSTSGDTGGTETHTHTISTASNSSSPFNSSQAITTTNATSTLPTYYEVVWIIRIK